MAEGGAAMPVIGIGVDALRERLGRDLAGESLLRSLEEIGCDVEGFARLSRTRCVRCDWIEERTETEDPPARCDRCDVDHREAPETLEELEPIEVVRMELLAVRPDMFDPGGLARALRGYLEIETGLSSYAIGPVAATVRCDESIRDPESLRPFISCAILENVRLDGDSVKVLMKLQENLHWALGRNRKHASIGVYDFDTVSSEITYTTEDPDRYRFVPLGAAGTGEEHRVALRTILEEHPKGRAYRHLLERYRRYPILRDGDGRVLSMPPIINSEETKVHPRSTRLFIDVTGMGERVVTRTLNILITSLLDLLPDARAHAVRIEGASDPAGAGARDAALETPDLTPQTMRLDVARTARLIGIPLDSEAAVGLLERMRHEAKPVDDDRIEVSVAAYRNDILHERDLMEDVAIAYGYHRIEGHLLPSRTVGQPLPLETLTGSVRECMAGLGFQEVMTLVLTNDEAHDSSLGREADPRAVRIENPISREQTRIRTRLLPGLLEIFRKNLHEPLPQRIFEVGDVSLLDEEAETRASEHRLVAFGIVAPKTGFTDARAVVEAVGREFGEQLVWEPAAEPPFLEGRCARVRVGPVDVGVLGEIDPDVLGRFGLENPTVMGELSVDRLAGRPVRKRFVLQE
ncbi:MAG: phenylalanine--tRNA ligase subunit beta [Candidatus Eisenbacteria bacterium]|nr:phenylalanine--tRNA ligase subunit beta [Candidatus Latescibacterota bacterium]MBD3300892.1 phenylalanine--tRNA ligase subunit beta [Candidatus Eisenbacteria bacterium]